jgi:lipopolysaccharide/colanic/teichoic acid biosynthesis glycosyltransferase
MPNLLRRLNPWRTAPRGPVGSAPGGLYARGLKRGLDVALALAAAPVVLPLIVLCAATIWMLGRAPLESHALVGRSGRTFRVWRFRVHARDAHGVLRATGLGRFMRRSGLELLPLWWNVLVGDMSLVGPRALIPSQRGLYPGLAYRRLRPGVTGYWQIAGLHGTTFAERAKIDAEYAAVLSLRVDLLLMRRVLGAALRRDRAT